MTNIEKAVKVMQTYWNTYDKQYGYKDYSDKTFIEDALYSIGIAINEDYTFADGFARFKRLLIKHLQEQP